MMIGINYVFAFFGLLFAMIFDVRTREVPDWLNFSMIALGIGTSLIASILESNFFLLLYSLLGVGAGFVIGWLLYRFGQWGGGDAKAMIGLGALLGLNFLEGVPLFLVVVLNIFIAGAVIGLFWTLVIALKNFRVFKKAFRGIIISGRILLLRKIVILLSVVLLAVAFTQELFFRIVIIGVAAIIFFMFYFYVFSKAVEQSCMQKKVPISKLTEGDWVMEKVVYEKKVLCRPKDAVTKEQISALLKLKGKKVILIREGIPFIPSFFAGFVLLLLLGNWLLLLL